MLGYGKTATHYRLWDPEDKRVITATHVEFNENSTIASSMLEPDPDEKPMEEDHSTITNYRKAMQNARPIAVPGSRGGIEISSIENPEPQEDQLDEAGNQTVRRSTRTRQST